MSTSRFFDGTCEPFDTGNCTGEVLNELFVDPCSCRSYYQCGVDHEILHRQCAQGTAFDYQKQTCDREVNVFFSQKCNVNTDAWERCKDVSDTRLKELENMCKNITETTEDTRPPGTASTPSSSTDPGVIIGAVIAGAVITAIVIVAVTLCQKRRNTKLLRRRTTMNPEYFEGGNADDPYATINDSRMNTPVYSGSPSANGTIQSHVNDAFRDDSAEYDNSCATAPLDYTASINRSFRDHGKINRSNTGGTVQEVSDQHYDSILHTIQRKEAKHEGINVNMDENGNRNQSKNNGFSLGESSSSMQTEASVYANETSSSSLGSSETKHGYFTLGKEKNVVD